MKRFIWIVSCFVVAIALTVVSIFVFQGKAAKTATGDQKIIGTAEIVMQLGSPRALVNGKIKLIDPSDGRIIPIVENQTTMLPLRFFSEALGAAVTWNDATKTATIVYKGKTITLTEGSSVLNSGTEKIDMGAAAFSRDGRLFVPAQKICQAAGMTVTYKDDLILVTNASADEITKGAAARFAAAVPLIANLKTVASAADLVKLFQDNAKAQTALYGSGTANDLARKEAALAPNAAAQNSTAAGGGSVSLDYSQTNVQVQGVDEADTVKTDGKYIYKISGNSVKIILADPAAEMKVAASIDYANNEFVPLEMYVDGKYLTVIGTFNTNIVPINQPTAAPGSTDGSTGKAEPGSVPTPAIAPSAAVIEPAIVSTPPPAGANSSTAVTSGPDSSVVSSTGIAAPTSAPSTLPSEPSITAPDQTNMPYIYYGYSYTRVYVYDISDVANITTARTCDVDGYYVTSRKIGSSVYLIANKYNYYAPETMTADTVVPIYRDSVSTGTELKPMPLESIYYFGETFSPGYMTIAGIDLSKPDQAMNVNSYLGSGNTVYASTDNLYVTYPDYTVNTDNTTTTTTKLFKFSLTDGSAVFLSRGSVNGTLLNQFSMDEFGDGYFRVATTDQANDIRVMLGNVGSGVGGVAVPETAVTAGSAVSSDANAKSGSSGSGSAAAADATAPDLIATAAPAITTTPDPTAPANNVYVLDYALNVVGTIENVAPGERIYSVRFLGNRGYMVTYKNVDPLFVLDFTTPTDPKILGELKIPGFSDYLHPIDENHIIGFGKDTTDTGSGFALTGGMKVAIFDVTDPANPVESYSTIIGDRGTYSDLMNDHKALLFSLSKNLLVFPVNLYEIPNKANLTQSELQYQYGQLTFQGAYVYAINANMTLTLRGTITHLTGTDLNPNIFNSKIMGPIDTSYNRFISRSLYIGDTLYTISNSVVKAKSISDLSEISSLTY